MIAVYGATGYTGTLVAHELARRGLSFVLSGRDEGKLARLAADVADPAGPGSVPSTRAVALDDADGLRALLADCSAVIDCAGPFVRWGEPIVRAALDTGTHYLDTTGEQTYMQMLRERFDAPARDAGVALVPAMGFDYVPGDLLAHVTAQGVEPLRELTIAYATRGIQPTRGTTRTALGMAREAPYVFSGGALRRGSLLTGRGVRFAFPEPFGTRPVMRYPSGEALTVPHHVDTQSVRTLITVETLAGNDLAAPFVPLVQPALALGLRTPLRALVEPALSRIPEGPTPEARCAASFLVAVVADGIDGRVRHGVLRGTDVYGLTAVCAVHGAALMGEPGYDRSGVLSAATAYDPEAFLAALAPHGVAWETDRPG